MVTLLQSPAGLILLGDLYRRNDQRTRGERGRFFKTCLDRMTRAMNVELYSPFNDLPHRLAQPEHRPERTIATRSDFAAHAQSDNRLNEERLAHAGAA